MGRKGGKKGGKQKEGPSVVTEATRIRVGKVLEEFRLSSEQVYTFETGLSKYDRALIHEMCREMGMISRSSGKNDKRQLSVYKRKPVSHSRGVETKVCLKFSDKTKNILKDLFTRFPPDEAEFPEKIPEDSNKHNVKSLGKQDNCFRRPLLNNNEITKKRDTLASKMNGDANHQKVAQERAKLPIASYKDVITSTVDSHKVVLISGETGCGKTTQVPQYILDHMWSKGEACKIVCTQPRRISAISVAERISFERGENVGDTVGYKIRLESKGGKHSSVMFCTNGVLLRILIGRGVGVPDVETTSRSSRDYILEITHIIVDEIHERDRFSDFMLAILRDLLALDPHLRLILMSATMDADRFSQYFGGCPIIRIPGFTYPVKSFYLEDVLSMLRSSQENHLGATTISASDKETHLTDDYNASLDESIDLALWSDEIDPLLEVVSANVTPKTFSHQHSSTGISPLMVFARKGMVDEVYMLLSLGADCGVKDSDGSTALDWAQREGQSEISEILKEQMQKDMSKTNDSQELLDKYLASIDPENIDTVLIERLLHKICTDSQDGAILVFLPGWDAINQTREKLLASPFFGDSSKFVILALHSMIPSIEQMKVFRKPPAGARKIILSTNIAETAVTIDDVVYVIDCGRLKEKNYDPYNNVSRFYSSWVSKASAKQREGRAGRCQPGICYHLYSKARAESLADHQLPEIKRMPIEGICLQVKLLDSNHKIIDFLQKTLDPPVHEAVHNAILVLQDIGALTHDEKLTELGEKLGILPVHPSISKMLFFAILMNCLDPALTLACTADYRDPFVLPIMPEERKRASTAKIELASLYGGYSDHLTVIAAFDCWKRAKDTGQESLFCSKYFVSAGTMNILSNMRKQLQNELTENGFIPKDGLNCSLNAQNPGILRAILLAGTYPMVGRMLPPQKNNRRAVVETSSGAKVTFHSHSSNFKLSFSKSKDGLLLSYDEITRAEGRMYIKSCSVVGPYPLLLLATEMVVAPSNENKCESDEELSDSEEMEVNVAATSGQKEEEIMSSPENNVMVIIDQWLNFESTALDVAQIYCLRQRLKAAILHKVKHPRKAQPAALEASVDAIASILSCDGMVGISPPLGDAAGHIPPNSSPIPGRKACGKKFSNNSNGYLRSLMMGDTRSAHPFHCNSGSSKVGSFGSPASNACKNGVGRASTGKSPSLKRRRRNQSGP